MVWVGLFAVLGKLAGAAKEMAVAWRYGISAEVDAYLFVSNLISWPVSIWSSVLAVVLIPMEARIRAASPDALPRFRGEVLGSTMVIGGGLVVLALFTLPPLLASKWVGLPARTADLGTRMVPVLAWLALAGLLVGLYSTWTMSAGRHANTLLEGVPALAILCGVLFTAGIEPLIWGTLAGTLVQLACLAAPIGAHGEQQRPRFSHSSPDWSPFWQGFGIMMLGQGILSVTIIIDQLFAARLGEGAISALGYAGRFLALLNGMVATAVTRATLPVFARAQALGSTDVRRLARRWAGGLFVVGVIVVAIGWLLAPWGVRVLFERGTFTASDTTTVARLLRFGLLQLPFYFAGLVFVSLHSSYGRYTVLFMVGVVGLTAKVIAIYALLPTFGVGALMLSSVVVYAANAALLAGVHSR
jgi:peptidoglycan biosynthesis protein MviN/MurJ (putative lipid II flippase)